MITTFLKVRALVPKECIKPNSERQREIILDGNTVTLVVNYTNQYLRIVHSFDSRLLQRHNIFH